MFKLIFRLALMGSLVYVARKALQRWIDGPEPAPGTSGILPVPPPVPTPAPVPAAKKATAAPKKAPPAKAAGAAKNPGAAKKATGVKKAAPKQSPDGGGSAAP